MGRHEVISIEEYLAKRKALKEQQQRRDNGEKKTSDKEKSQVLMPFAYYDMLSLES